ncbi:MULTISPECIES: type II toxin-antitoxin system ParD family antitoxin [Sphingobium]|uniref:type II toxin-antitoxin system ParD family antitoxin n=1 Tax=Sphingobium TaxID=165695 RepID=UPI0009715094|nr:MULTISPECIES: type II toxin-antitoxin system ParD family antitoxin [Sphingobium]MCB4859009.1 type II toxin-antitoxin system ParD family antitoxin [Sphingobium sp. PNB]MEC6701532.1 type II toxin-antitoxin system ParD family antitoxin [Sphingobium sp. SJ10-10]NML91600.1 type II toxin-antitoxin system ParD family antitoxin [Sphingobium sp. TB-6]
MNVSVGERWEGFVETVVKSGRYGSASEVVREGLRLVEEREVKLISLRDTLNASIAARGEHDADDVRSHLTRVSEELNRSKKLSASPRLSDVSQKRSG